MASYSLVGPPEIRNPKPSPSLATAKSANTGNPFLDVLSSNFNSITKPLTPPKSYTANHSPTFLSTGNPCLDFFYHVVPDTPEHTLTDRLQKAYIHCPVTTVKLICNLRGVRGTGKSDKEGFYKAALWLHKFHPKTLACNVGSIAGFGCIKDLPEILYRLILGNNVREIARSAHLSRKLAKNEKLRGRRSDQTGGYESRSDGYEIRRPFGHKSGRGSSNRKKQKKSRESDEKTREARILASRKRDAIEKEEAKKRREERKISNAKTALVRYCKDPDYKFLFERIADFFAESLKADLLLLESGKLNDISLAAKWCPSLDSSYDRVTLLCERIGRKMFPKEEYEDGLLEAHYAYRVRDRLRKQVLVPLRKALLQRAKNVKDKEMKVGGDGEKVKAKKKGFPRGKVSDGWFPHEIIAGINDGDGKLADSQWRRMVDRLSKKGKFKNCLAVCDVSSKMNDVKMEVTVALAVLVSELSEEPWGRNIVTLSSKPQLHKVEGEDLRSKIDFVREMDLGGSPDFQKVFDLILQAAIIGNLKEDQMIKRVFVFSDMEFYQSTRNNLETDMEFYQSTRNNLETDMEFYQSTRNNLETDYEAITRKFTEKGYCLPEIVFWNVRESKATPVTANQPGVALVSGFSKNLMTLFLEDNGPLNPEKFMEKVIAGEKYGQLEVLD